MEDSTQKELEKFKGIGSKQQQWPSTPFERLDNTWKYVSLTFVILPETKDES